MFLQFQESIMIGIGKAIDLRAICKFISLTHHSSGTPNARPLIQTLGPKHLFRMTTRGFGDLNAAQHPRNLFHPFGLA